MRSTTETGPTTTEELEFKDVPIYEKEKLKKPPPGFKYAPVLKCNNDVDKDAPTPSNDQIILDEEKSHEIAPALEVADQSVRPSLDEERQVTTPSESEDSNTVVPDSATEDANPEESTASADKIVIAANKEAEENITSVNSIDSLVAAEEPIKSAQITDENVESEEPSATSADTTEKVKTGPSIPSLSLELEGEPIRVTEAKPEFDNVNTSAVSDAKVKPVETDVLKVEGLPSQQEVAEENADVSKNTNAVPQLQTVVGNFDVGASIDLDSVTQKSNVIDENFETNGAMDVNDDKVKDYTGYKVYRVTIPTEEVLARVPNWST